MPGNPVCEPEPDSRGLVPAIHDLRHKLCRFPWIPGTSLHHLNKAEH